MASSKIVILALFCLVQQVFSFWTACPNGRLPIDVQTPHCTSNGCHAVRGEPFKMTVLMDFLQSHQQLRPRATIFIFGVGIQIPDVPGHDDVCPHLLLNGQHHGCPVAPQVQYTWDIDMLVPTNIPAFQNGRIRVEILEGTNVLICFDAHGTMT
ncbi:uncharacterized protein [Chironomus tepperi]|uniref:uncharacterized protein n=1 Tax=Chironomus tepperi TaxID=113505 RepID=UPI00391FBAC2